MHAELTLGTGLAVGHIQVELLMARAGLKGLPGNRRPRCQHETPTATDLVEQMSTREALNRLWITDITEHRTYEGKVYCAVVLDTFSQRVVGWPIDSSQTAALVTNAPSMAIANHNPQAGIVVHSDHDVQFNSQAFTDRAKQSGLVPSMSSIGDSYDSAMMESSWGRMQSELPSRKRWKARIELANEIFDYLEIFHNRQRRHSALGMRTPIEFELLHQSAQPVA